MKLTVIEGNTIRLDGGAMFGNAPKELWKRWLPADDKNRIDLACRTLLITTDDGRNILFEAGTGVFFEPKLRERYGVIETEHMLLKNLQLHGIKETDIDVVILSHLHFDHVGGLLSSYEEGPLRLLFPNAHYYVGKEHWERALQPHMRERASFIPILHQLLKESERLVLLDKPTHADLDFGISFSFSDGHTIGLLVPLLECSDGPLGLVTDLVPGIPWLHRAIAMGYDRYPELLIDEKTEYLEKIYNKKGKLFLTHDPAVPCVVLQKDDTGRYSGEKLELE